MPIGDLIPMAVPALVIICVAVALALRGRSERDVVLDLRDAPSVRLDPEFHTASHTPAPVRGALVEPTATTLGARMRSVSPAVEVVERTAPPQGRVRITRRRHPLVAVGRPEPH